MTAPTLPRRPFATLLRTRGVGRLLAANLTGRLSSTSAGLALVLLVSDVRGAFGPAGVTSGAFTVGIGVGSPALGRLVDRVGQRPVLTAAAAVQTATLLALAAVADAAPLGVIVALAALAGASNPPLAACLRALWSRLVGRGPLLQSAFALESTVQEAVFILGPLLVAGLVAAASTTAALLGVALAGLAGTLWFAAAPEARTRPDRGRQGGAAWALRSPGLPIALGLMLLVALGLGLVAVSVPAFAADAGQRAAAGPVLALWAVGSMAGGLAIGPRPWPPEPATRLVVLLAALAVLTLPLAAAPGLIGLGALVALSGVPIAPSIACVYLVVDRLSPPAVLTEAFTWLSSAIMAGVAGGESLGGVIADRGGPSSGLLAAALAACAAAAAAAAARPRLASRLRSAS
jgi:MFS family permease